MGRDLAIVRLGEVASLGVLVYAIAKFGAGALTDLVGGRRSFLSGMLLSSVFTVGFALSGALPFFTLAWMGNRLVQSIGWVGMVRISSRWFAWSSYGTALGIVSLSFLFGDAAARWLMGTLLAMGASWRQVFFAAALGLVLLLLLSRWLVRESPAERGAPEPEEPPDTVYADRDAPPGTGLRALLAPLLASRVFWVVCTLSLGLTFLRESFNTWTPTYFVEALQLPPDRAASYSALFPFFGGVSVLLAGWGSDRLGRGGRAWIMVGGIAASALTLLALGAADLPGVGVPVAVVALTGFLLIGPYSYLAGAISLDFGGKRGAATAAGVIDGVGYIGGALAGGGVARLAVGAGWDGVFLALAGVAALTACAALLLVRRR